jgi:DNA-binding NarL/FixJ family response regulator
VSPSGITLRAGTVLELVTQAYRNRPEFVALAEPWLRHGGFDLLDDLAAAHQSHVVVFGEELSALSVAHGIQRGLRGTLPVDVSVEIIEKALISMRAGELWLSRRCLLEAMAATSSGSESATGTWQRLPSLSEREHAVLVEVLGGLGNKDIAKKLAISENTVKAHVQHLYLKLGVHRRVDLMRACLGHAEGRPGR